MESATVEGVVGALLGGGRGRIRRRRWGIRVHLVVTGSADAIIPPAESGSLARGIPGSRLEVIPGAGHLVAFEQPDAFNRVLKDWLVRTGFSA